jgi:hypothetical protein
MRDLPVASDLSKQVLEMRRLRGELGPCELDSSNRRLYSLPCAVVQREAYIASRETPHDDKLWNAMRAFEAARAVKKRLIHV